MHVPPYLPLFLIYIPSRIFKLLQVSDRKLYSRRFNFLFSKTTGSGSPLRYTKMTLRNSLMRPLPFGSSNSEKRASSSQRSSFYFLTAKKPLTSTQITELKRILSLSVSSHTFNVVMSSLPQELLCRGRSKHSADICSVHASLSSAPLIELAKLIACELHPRLAHLYAFPRSSLSRETEEYLYSYLAPYRAYFPYLPSYGAGRNGGCESELGATCLACTLSLLFRDQDAMKALAVCAKSRRKHGVWPDVLNWLEWDREEGWEGRWKGEAEGVRRDRRRAKVWRRCGGGSAEKNEESED